MMFSKLVLLMLKFMDDNERTDSFDSHYRLLFCEYFIHRISHVDIKCWVNFSPPFFIKKIIKNPMIFCWYAKQILLLLQYVYSVQNLSVHLWGWDHLEANIFRQFWSLEHISESKSQKDSLFLYLNPPFCVILTYISCNLIYLRKFLSEPARKHLMKIVFNMLRRGV